MKLMVTGGRDYDDEKMVFDVLDEIHAKTPIKLLIHGNAKGADALAQLWCNDRGVPFKAFPAKWKQYGKAAGPIRNQDMINEKPWLLVAFPGGTGTANAVFVARRHNIPVQIIPPRRPI